MLLLRRKFDEMMVLTVHWFSYTNRSIYNFQRFSKCSFLCVSANFMNKNGAKNKKFAFEKKEQNTIKAVRQICAHCTVYTNKLYEEEGKSTKNNVLPSPFTTERCQSSSFFPLLLLLHMFPIVSIRFLLLLFLSFCIWFGNRQTFLHFIRKRFHR